MLNYRRGFFPLCSIEALSIKKQSGFTSLCGQVMWCKLKHSPLYIFEVERKVFQKFLVNNFYKCVEIIDPLSKSKDMIKT